MGLKAQKVCCCSWLVTYSIGQQTVIMQEALSSITIMYMATLDVRQKAYI
jgi:hypothetical protein